MTKEIKEVKEVKTELILSTQDENIANLMLETKGNLTLVSRFDSVSFNSMALRSYVAKSKTIRPRYHQLLAEELQEQGLHIAERILEMSRLQQDAYGDPENDIPPDPRMAIELSKEISRLIAEGRKGSMSGSTANTLVTKEDAKELLTRFLDSV